MSYMYMYKLLQHLCNELIHHPVPMTRLVHRPVLSVLDLPQFVLEVAAFSDEVGQVDRVASELFGVEGRRLSAVALVVR